MDLFKAKMSALSYMDDYGLLDKCWHFDFQNKKRALGTCSYVKKSILLSSWYVKLNEESDVEDTILHEIAHALSFIRYGKKGMGHGRLWKKVCREIGARPERLHKGILEYPENHYKYVDTCGCDITYKRHRISKFAKYRCPKCREPLFDSKRKKEWLSAKVSADYWMEKICEKNS